MTFTHSEKEKGRRRRVLVLAYFYPPIGGGSSQRNAGLIRRLPELGYEPVVVTGSGSADHFWAPDVESAHTSGDPGRVVRVPGPEPGASTGLRRRLERLLDLDGAWYRWWINGALEAAGREVAECDLVYASLEPYETAHIASVLCREQGKPWVAELLDPWALDEMRMHVSGIHRRRDLSKMRRWLASAAAVIMNTPEATARVRREIPELSSALVDPIAVGYDAADFMPPVAFGRRDGTFRIVHTGYLHTEIGQRHRKTGGFRRLLGGLYSPVNVLTRSHVYLLRAIDRLLSENPALESVIEVHLVGALSEADRSVAARSPVVRAHGYLPHDDTVALVRTADLLFLPMHELPRGSRAGLVPAKTYEYLASGRPILAAVPDGDARDLLLEAGNARVCLPSDDVAMAEHLRAEIDRWGAEVRPDGPKPEVVARYERGVVAKQLASVFDDVLREPRPQVRET